MAKTYKPFKLNFIESKLKIILPKANPVQNMANPNEASWIDKP